MPIEYKKREELFGQMLMVLKENKDHTLVAQPAQGVDVQDVYDKLKLLEEHQKYRDIISIPVRMGSIAYTVEESVENRKQIKINVVEILDASYLVSNNEWRLLIRIFGKAEEWWAILNKEVFLKVEEAVEEQKRRTEVNKEDNKSEGEVQFISDTVIDWIKK